MYGDENIQNARRGIIEAIDLRIGYSDNDHFPEISAQVCESEFIVLLGRNGVGKSTLLKTLAGLQTSFGGVLNLMGRPVNRYKQSRRAELVSYVSTERIKVRDMTVADLVALGRYSHTDWLGKPSEEDKLHINNALLAAGVARLAKKNVNALSDGELQRCMIARTLAQDTPLIILDEPTAFLDLPNKIEIMHILSNLSSEKGKTIVMSTHDLDLAMRMADKLWIMSAAGLTEGAPEDLALNEGLNDLFAETGFYFDYSRGIVAHNNSEEQSITFDGENENLKFWLAKALKRVGFNPIESSYHPLIKTVNKGGKLEFEYRNGEQNVAFGSIYELAIFLKNTKRKI
ncbi:MAG: ABC transporter ATP-binding protein [Prevotellaceae bacterium]|jgi:iron complex transport system ATP-binding protein|nr:ABC transporter ATP-binding protein [Prevotellaceae bacterium]